MRSTLFILWLLSAIPGIISFRNIHRFMVQFIRHTLIGKLGFIFHALHTINHPLFRNHQIKFSLIRSLGPVFPVQWMYSFPVVGPTFMIFGFEGISAEEYINNPLNREIQYPASDPPKPDTIQSETISAEHTEIYSCESGFILWCGN